MPKFYTMKASKLPSRSEVGDLFFTSDTRESFVCVGDGRLVNLNGLLSCQPITEIGPQGERGLKGDAGERGPQGVPGVQGEPGKNGSVGPAGRNGANGLPGQTGKPGNDGAVGAQGPAGAKGELGPQGPKGDKGERGDVLIPNSDELSAAVIAYRQKHARAHAAILAEISKSSGLRPSTRLHVQRVLKNIQKELQ
jgi:hypothetical protein